MTLPDRDMAVAWVGRTLIDRDGVEIGSCTAVFADDATQQAEWVCAEHAGVAVLLPAVGAAESGGQVQVVISRADIDGAPPVSVERHISTDDEASLYRHYGIPHSTDDSPSVLPTAEPDATPGPRHSLTDSPADSLAADSLTTDSLTTDSLTTDSLTTDSSTADSRAADSRAADSSVADPAGAPAVTADSTAAGTVDSPATTPSAAQNGLYSSPRAGEPDTTPDSPRRGPKLVSAGAGLALAAAAVLGVRRLRNRRPATRTERLAERGRVASAILSARTAKLAASAAPVVETTTRRPARTGAVLTAVAAALAAARRRFGTPDREDPATRR